jgi:hypothetical protein
MEIFIDFYKLEQLIANNSPRNEFDFDQIVGEGEQLQGKIKYHMVMNRKEEKSLRNKTSGEVCYAKNFQEYQQLNSSYNLVGGILKEMKKPENHNLSVCSFLNNSMHDLVDLEYKLDQLRIDILHGQGPFIFNQMKVQKETNKKKSKMVENTIIESKKIVENANKSVKQEIKDLYHVRKNFISGCVSKYKSTGDMTRDMLKKEISKLKGGTLPWYKRGFDHFYRSYLCELEFSRDVTRNYSSYLVKQEKVIRERAKKNSDLRRRELQKTIRALQTQKDNLWISDSERMDREILLVQKNFNRYFLNHDERERLERLKAQEASIAKLCKVDEDDEDNDIDTETEIETETGANSVESVTVED